MNFVIAGRKFLRNIRRLVYYLKSINYSEYYYQYLEYIEKLIKDFKGLNYLRFASFSYIPLFGWILPLVMRKDNRFCTHHAKQGFILAALFIFSAILLNLINIFTPVEWRVFRLSLVIFIYIFYLAYASLCFIVLSRIAKGRDFNISFLKKFVDLIAL